MIFTVILFFIGTLLAIIAALFSLLQFSIFTNTGEVFAYWLGYLSYFGNWVNLAALYQVIGSVLFFYGVWYTFKIFIWLARIFISRDISTHESVSDINLPRGSKISKSSKGTVHLKPSIGSGPAKFIYKNRQ